MARQDKKNTLLTKGRVHPVALHPNGHGIKAEVDGDSGTYTTAVWYDKNKIKRRYCTCPYSTKFHEGKRDCSHVLAVEELVRKP